MHELSGHELAKLSTSATLNAIRDAAVRTALGALDVEAVDPGAPGMPDPGAPGMPDPGAPGMPDAGATGVASAAAPAAVDMVARLLAGPSGLG